MFNKKNLLKIGSFAHSFGQGGPLSEDQMNNENKSENEDDLLIEALFEFVSENYSMWNNSKMEVTVNDKSYFLILNPDKSFLTLKQFIRVYYPRGSTLIFEEGFVAYIAVSVFDDELDVAIIDAYIYSSHKLQGIALSLNEEIHQIVKKIN